MKIPSFNTFCRWFTSLDEHFGAGPAITADDLVAFLRSAAVTSGSGAAARFCLAVWNHFDNDFDVREIGSWDDAHRAAFSKWAADPFWY